MYMKLSKLIHLFCRSGENYSLLQFLKFGIVGISNTMVSYLINLLVLLSLKDLRVNYDYIIGNSVAFILSVLWSFFWNSRLVFEVQKEKCIWKSLARAYISYGFTGIFLNNVLSVILISRFGICKYIAPLLNLLISVPINFILNKYWTFKSE